MTAAELLVLPARDLDAMVAEKVMGWRRVPGMLCDRWESPDDDVPGGWVLHLLPLSQFSDDWNHMALVLARLHELHPNWRVEIMLPVRTVGWTPDGAVKVWTPIGCISSVPFATVAELPRAVCVAAVLAMEGVK